MGLLLLSARFSFTSWMAMGIVFAGREKYVGRVPGYFKHIKKSILARKTRLSRDRLPGRHEYRFVPHGQYLYNT
jgi:hypothetical protein